MMAVRIERKKGHPMNWMKIVVQYTVSTVSQTPSTVQYRAQLFMRRGLTRACYGLCDLRCLRVRLQTRPRCHSPVWVHRPDPLSVDARTMDGVSEERSLVWLLLLLARVMNDLCLGRIEIWCG